MGRFFEFARKTFLTEVLVVMLLGSVVWEEAGGLTHLRLVGAFVRDLSSGTFGKKGRDSLVSFLEDNLDVYDCSELDSAVSGNKWIDWPSGIPKGPVFLWAEEKKPYYIYNIDVYYSLYSIRLFRKFTLGDGSARFAGAHKEIKAVLSHKEDVGKFGRIGRKIKATVVQDGDSVSPYIVGPNLYDTRPLALTIFAD